MGIKVNEEADRKAMCAADSEGLRSNKNDRPAQVPQESKDQEKASRQLDNEKNSG
jgi:hypothetical protein